MGHQLCGSDTKGGQVSGLGRLLWERAVEKHRFTHRSLGSFCVEAIREC